MIDTWPKTIRTKIVGTTFEGRQDILAECRRQGVEALSLVPEPTSRYDPHAIAVEAQITSDSGRVKTARLGFLSNSDRICSDCGMVVGGALFEKSRRLRCPECGQEFGYDSPVVTAGRDRVPVIECPGCGSSVELGLAKVVHCPSCGGTTSAEEGFRHATVSMEAGRLW